MQSQHRIIPIRASQGSSGALTKNRQRPYRVDQTVWVRDLKDILKTLDSEGKLDGLPFMLEMIPYCGRSFRVSALPNRTCVEGIGICEFSDIVFLEGLRCDGGGHDGCQRRCLLFWKEAWLSSKPSTPPDAAGAAEAVLKTMRGDRYICQSTELAGAATAHQEKDPALGEKLRQNFHDLRLGNVDLMDFSWHISKAVMNRLSRLTGIAKGQTLQGSLRRTESASLNLQPGDLVEVKERQAIEATLDPSGRNKGLLFTPTMLQYCGKRYRVGNRLQRMILEETGEMIQLQDTVVLEGITCQEWGCQRSNLLFWREIWLRRVEPPRAEN